MSLLNDMLQDLDGDKKNIAPDSEPQAVKPKSKVKSLLLPAIAIVAVVAWLVIELDVLGLFPKKAPAALPEDYTLNSNWSDRLKAQKAEQEEAPASVDVANKPAEAQTQPQSKADQVDSKNFTSQNTNNLQESAAAVAQLLAHAQERFERGQLLHPKNDNAYQLYSNVLILSPGNQVAIDGINAIRDYAKVTLEDTAKAGDARALESAIAQAELAELSTEVIDAYQKRLERMQVASSTKTVKTTESKKEVVEKSAKQTDIELANHIKSGELLAHEQRALSVLTHSKEYQRTALALVKAYFQMGDVQKLGFIQATLEARSQSISNYSGAHKHTLLGEYEKAIELLVPISLPSGFDVERMRMLAALYQMNNNWSSAEAIYANLSASPQATVDDWLGLAVANQNLGNEQKARLAFERVVYLGHEDPNIINYAKTRVKKLAKR